LVSRKRRKRKVRLLLQGRRKPGTGLPNVMLGADSGVAVQNETKITKKRSVRRKGGPIVVCQSSPAKGEIGGEMFQSTKKFLRRKKK